MPARIDIRPLPCHEGANSDTGPKRLFFPQGEFALLHPACPEIRFLAFLGFKPGIPRGGHYHPGKTECFYLLHGEVELTTRDRESGATAVHRLKAGDLVTMSPNIEHRYLAAAEAEAIEFSATPWAAEDTIKVNPA
ncbi:MAG TPA: cupin domain-containing protein [Opitutaceae bacterium]|nr:cupin domain-containing protein [Opitutaceae bacterium]HOR25123.1 cupin domain-containing protein [Opitutaceae bacterium]HPK49520.1 cupin domain-containing protein [Opitutaceae bacterium]